MDFTASDKKWIDQAAKPIFDKHFQLGNYTPESMVAFELDLCALIRGKRDGEGFEAKVEETDVLVFAKRVIIGLVGSLKEIEIFTKIKEANKAQKTATDDKAARDPKEWN